LGRWFRRSRSTGNKKLTGIVRRRRGIVTLLPYFLAACVLGVLTWVTWEYVEDDAYIHCVFARNLWRGCGFSFNPGEILLGDTSPLWVFLLVGARGLLLSLEAASKILSAAFALICCWVFVRLAERSAGARGRRIEFRAWCVALFLCHPFFLAIIPSGMETSFALAWLLGFILISEVVSGSGGARACAGVGLAGALGVLVRPEFLLLGPCFAGSVLVRWASGVSREDHRVVMKRLAGFGIAWVAGVVAIALVLQGYFGQVLPTTMRAKSLDSHPFAAAAAMRTLKVLALGYGVIGLMGAGVAVVGRRLGEVMRRIPMTLHLWAAMLVAEYVAISANVQTRYLLLVWPWFAMMFALSLTGVNAARLRRAAWLCGVLAVAGQSCLMAFPALASRVYNAKQMRVLSDAVVRDTPEDSVLALYAIGQVAYETERRVVDVGCIVTPEMAEIPAGRRLEYAAKRGATHAIVLARDIPRLGIERKDVLAEASFRNATWEFPPSRYWEGVGKAVVRLKAAGE